MTNMAIKIPPDLQSWIDARPPHVRAVANLYPPNTCYFAMNAGGLRGHYYIQSYEENKDGEVTVKVGHLDDSFLPGFAVFGFDPYDLFVCGCQCLDKK